MTSWCVGLRRLCIVLAGLLPSPCRGQRVPAGVKPPETVIIAGKPRIVVPADAVRVSISPNGRYAIVEVTPDSDGEPVQTRLLTLNTATGKTATAWAVSSPFTTMETALWFPGSSIAFVQVCSESASEHTVDATFLRVDARKGTAKTIESVDHDGDFYPSPSKPIVVCDCFLDDGANDLIVLKADGSVARRARIEPLPSVDGTPSIVWFDGWSPDGVSIRLMNASRSWNGEGFIVPGENRSWRLWNTTTGALTPVASEPPSWKPPRVSSQMWLDDNPVILLDGPAKAMIRPVWLCQGSGKACRRQLISADSDWCEIAPSESAILVRSHGTVSLTPLKRLTGNALTELRESEQTTAISQGREIGYALRQFYRDHNSAYPPTDDGFSAAISPLIRRPDDLIAPGTGTGFVYFPGKAVGPDSPEAASTILGYLPMDTGRAVVYADGHSAWVPD